MTYQHESVPSSWLTKSKFSFPWRRSGSSSQYFTRETYTSFEEADHHRRLLTKSGAYCGFIYEVDRDGVSHELTEYGFRVTFQRAKLSAALKPRS